MNKYMRKTWLLVPALALQLAGVVIADDQPTPTATEQHAEKPLESEEAKAILTAAQMTTKKIEDLQQIVFSQTKQINDLHKLVVSVAQLARAIIEAEKPIQAAVINQHPLFKHMTEEQNTWLFKNYEQNKPLLTSKLDGLIRKDA